MENAEGLLIGIDLQESQAQVAFYDEQNRTPQNAMFGVEKYDTDNPWKLSEWINHVQSGRDLEQLAGYIALLLEQAKKEAGRMKISHICFTIDDFYTEILNVIATIMEHLGVAREQWSIISHEECFAYYAFEQRRDLFASGAILLDYRYDGLHAYMMQIGKVKNQFLIMENGYYLTNDAMILVGKKKSPLSMVQAEMVDYLAGIFKEHPVSSVYLTGSGFDVDEFPEALTRFLCEKRKVFAGQNLFVKGACYAAWLTGTTGSNNELQNMILACRNRITTGVELDIVERQAAKRLRVVKPGTNWYEAYRQMDFIAEDIRSFDLILRPSDGSNDYVESIDISEIPFREGKMTRLRVEFAFLSDNKMTVTIKDRGFGDFVRSSGKVITKEIAL